MRTRLLMAACLVVCLGCGGSGPRLAAPEAPTVVDASAFLMAYAAEHTSFTRPTESIEVLEQGRQTAQGQERRRVLRDLVLAYLFAADAADMAESAEEFRTAAEHRRKGLRLAQQLARGTRDDYLKAEMAFAVLWMSWRAEERGVARLAERFVDRHLNAGDLFIMGWLVRGEIALEARNFEEAATAYRYVVALIEHPLYAFALYRTAQCLDGQDRADDARQAREEVRQMGCADQASPQTDYIAQLAARELGTGLRRDPDGRARPQSCPAPTAAD